MPDSTIVCPHCHQALIYKEGINYCSVCSFSFSYKHGILDFLLADDFYWGEIDLPKMRQINKQIKKENWYSVIARLLPEKLGYIVDPGRLGWLFHCYDPDSNQACLDLGSGWGSLTLWMGKSFPNARITAVSNSAPQRRQEAARDDSRQGAQEPLGFRELLLLGPQDAQADLHGVRRDGRVRQRQTEAAQHRTDAREGDPRCRMEARVRRRRHRRAEERGSLSSVGSLRVQLQARDDSANKWRAP